MSDFRCPFYYWDGNWHCMKSSGHTCTSYEYSTYCSDKMKYVLCPYFKK